MLHTGILSLFASNFTEPIMGRKKLGFKGKLISTIGHFIRLAMLAELTSIRQKSVRFPWRGPIVLNGGLSFPNRGPGFQIGGHFFLSCYLELRGTGCSLNIVFFFKILWFSELCKFCCSAGVLPAWCVYTRWNRGKTEKGQRPEYFLKNRKKHNI